MKRSTAPRVLFTSPYIPNPKASVRDDNIDFFYYRNTLYQGIFQLRQMQSWHPLHFLAQNLPVDSVVLENPTWRRFQHEVRQGRFDVVGFSFTVVAARKILEMVRWLRAEFPDIEIILGGYGTAIFNGSYGLERDLAQQVDHICRGEGLSFMRTYLAERWSIADKLPMRQDLLPARISFFRTRQPIFRQFCFLSSLGCYHNCSFCATSSQYGKAKIQVTSPRELFELIRRQAVEHPEIESAIIYDENFLADRRKVLEFISYLEADPHISESNLLFTVFSSVRSIQRYQLSELIRCRIGIIFIGVESFIDEVLRQETPRKREVADIAALFRKMHEAGISTLGSMIAGWDSHTPENIRQEMADFMDLNPTLYQIIPLQAVPGTPLWARLKTEGRLLRDYAYDKVGVNRPSFYYRHFSHDELLDQINETYRDLVVRGGPSVFKLFENTYSGYRNFRTREEPELRLRARIYRRTLPRLFILAFLSRFLFHGEGFRERWRRTMGDVFHHHPWRMVGGSLLSLFLMPFILLYCLSGNLRHHLSRHGDQPDTIRKAYQLSGFRTSASPVTAVPFGPDA